MSNQICAIFLITRKQYEYMTSRLSAFGVTSLGNRQLQFCVSTFSPEYMRKQQQQSRKPLRKNQQSLIRLSDSIGSTFLMGPVPVSNPTIQSSPNYSNTGLDDKMIYQATFLRSDNNFQLMIKNWALFNDLKELLLKTVQMQIYEWRDSIVIEAVQGEKDEILLILTDKTSTNFIDKNRYIDKDYWRKKLLYHFRQIYLVLCGTYSETIHHEGYPAQQLVKSKIQQQLDDKIRRYIEKMIRFNAMHGIKITQFWMLKTALIVEFLAKNYQSLIVQGKENKDKKMEHKQSKESKEERGKKQEEPIVPEK